METQLQLDFSIALSLSKGYMMINARLNSQTCLYLVIVI